MFREITTEKALQSLEKIVNAYLNLDPEINTALLHMEGTTIEFTVTGLFQCYCQITAARLHLTKQSSIPAQLALEASVLDYLRLMKNPNAPDIRFQFKGNLEKARQFQSLLTNLNIDWEEQVAQRVGDPVAVMLFRFLQGASHWAKDTGQRLSSMMTEYLQNEAQILPISEQIEDFLIEIDELRHSVARLEAKITHLTQNMKIYSLCENS